MWGIVIASAKKTFFAGGNLRSMVQAGPDDAEAIFTMGEAIKDSLRRLERFPRPVVAAINGAALGGAFEIALAAVRRIIIDDPRAEGQPGLARPAGGSGMSTSSACSRLPARADGTCARLVSGRSSRCRPWSTSWSSTIDELVPKPRRHRSSSTRATTTWRPTVGPGQLGADEDSGRSRRWRRLLAAAFPALLRQQAGRSLAQQRSRRRSRTQVDFDLACGSSRAPHQLEVTGRTSQT